MRESARPKPKTESEAPHESGVQPVDASRADDVTGSEILPVDPSAQVEEVLEAEDLAFIEPSAPEESGPKAKAPPRRKKESKLNPFEDPAFVAKVDAAPVPEEVKPWFLERVVGKSEEKRGPLRPRVADIYKDQKFRDRVSTANSEHEQQIMLLQEIRKKYGTEGKRNREHHKVQAIKLMHFSQFIEKYGLEKTVQYVCEEMQKPEEVLDFQRLFENRCTPEQMAALDKAAVRLMLKKNPRLQPKELPPEETSAEAEPGEAA